MAKAHRKSRRPRRQQPHNGIHPVSERQDSRPTRPTSVARWVLPVLVLTGALVYGNSLSGPFVIDDISAIVENAHIREIWPWNALAAPAQTSVAGRPVVSLSLAVNYLFGGLEVEGYHVVNVLIHVLGALVLLGIVRQTLLGGRLPERFRRGADGTAVACALIWMVHPLQTETVNYITQRTESIMGLFYLLTLYCAIRASDSSRRDWWARACLLCCALGMASKEVMVTAPLMVLLYDRVFRFGSFAVAWRKRRRLYLGLAATWGILLALMWPGPRSHTAGFSTDVTPWSYALNQSRVVVEYLQLVVWPQGLVVYHGHPQPVSIGEVAPYVVAVGGLLVGTAAALWYRPGLGFLGAWFFVILAPTTSIVPIATEVAAERRLYLPLAGLVVLVVVLGRILIERAAWQLKQSHAGPFASAAKSGAVVVVALALAVTTMSRNEDYRSAESLWRTVIDQQPENWGAHGALGSALYTRGDIDGAVRSFRQALAINPNAPRSNSNLGQILLKQDQGPEAIVFLRRALEYDARVVRPDLHHALGLSLEAADRVDEAVSHYRRALELYPNFANAHYNLGNALGRQGKLDQAISHFRRALSLNPNYAQAHHNLGDALALSNDLEGALRHFGEAVRISPDFAVTWGRMAEIVGGHPDPEVRDPGQAVIFAQRAAELTDYENPAVLAQLAELHGAVGQYHKAMVTAQAALSALDESSTTPDGDALTRFLQERLDAYRVQKQIPHTR